MSITLRGILGPVVTTFQVGSGDVDLTAFTNNIRAHLAAGLHGIVVAGSTGEAPLLDERERAVLIQAARDVVPQDRLLIAGTGAESTRTCLRLTQLAAQRGADAVLVVAPHYYGSGAMSAAALRAHYLAVADQSPVPVVLYNIPKYMHFSLGPQLVADLSQHENIVGIKDSSGDLDLLSAYLNAQTGRFGVLTGNGSALQQALRMGARGGVLAVSLFAPVVALAVYEAMQQSAGEASAAERAQARLTPLNAKIVAELGIAGIKAAMERVGLEGGPTRAPLLPLGASERAQVAELLQKAELPLAA